MFNLETDYQPTIVREISDRDFILIPYILMKRLLENNNCFFTHPSFI